MDEVGNIVEIDNCHGEEEKVERALSTICDKDGANSQGHKDCGDLVADIAVSECPWSRVAGSPMKRFTVKFDSEGMPVVDYCRGLQNEGIALSDCTMGTIQFAAGNEPNPGPSSSSSGDDWMIPVVAALSALMFLCIVVGGFLWWKKGKGSSTGGRKGSLDGSR